MLAEFLRTLLVDCPRWARRLGLARENAAIAARHSRLRAAWEPHLAASRRAVLDAAVRCPQRHRALVIGAGDCLDVPVGELASLFDKIALADVVVSPAARRLARRFRGCVECVSWDATGALATLAAVRDTIDEAGAKLIFERADPGPPPGGEADLVVSANCLSQLGLVPGHALASAEADETLPDRCAMAAAKRHLSWLAARRGVRVLLADIARLDLAPDGRLLKRDKLRERYGVRPPDRTWRWDLAPIPEWDRAFHRVHEVGVWIDGP